MNKLFSRIPAINWRVAVALTSLVMFALTGSANDPGPH